MSAFCTSYRLLLISCGLFVSFSPELIHAQHLPDSTQISVERDIQRAIEEIDPEESGLNPEEIAEFIQNLASNPLNINRASADDLLQIPVMSFRIAQNIVQHRDQSGPFARVDDLINVRGIGEMNLRRIRPYVTVGSAWERSQDLYLNSDYWTANSRAELFSRYRRVLNEQEGYRRTFSDGGYAGSPVQYYQRFRYTSSRVSAVLVQEKDPGETLEDLTGFDYNGWHLAYRGEGKLKDLIIGDYSVAFGQGLLLWNGGAFGKGSQVRNVSKNDRGVRPYTSAQETNAFRGVAATYGDKVQFTGFYSGRQRSATVIDQETTRAPTNTGLHRTPNEIGRRNNLGQQTVGGRIRAEFPFGYTGISGYYNQFDKTIDPGSQPYQMYNFSGREQTAFSADYRLLFGPGMLFGEAVRTHNGGFGVLAGSEIDAGNSTDIILAYRNYDKSLQAIFGSGFGEQSGNPQNEEGFYIGLTHAVSGTVQVRTYIDTFRFPAARFRVSRPSSGFDWLGMIEYAPDRNLNIYAQFRHKIRERDYTATDGMGREIVQLGNHSRTSARFQGEYKVHRNIRLRTRLDLVSTQLPGAGTSRGYLLFQDIRFYPLSGLRIDARITVFDTDDFESRLYQFENDLLYVMSNSMLFDPGQRMYLVANYKASDRLEFWFKLSTTIYENRQTISSGLNEIEGNQRSDIGIQARVRF